jgi:heme-degrading monooxygenase HmoA
MSVKILIKRNVPQDKVKELMPIVKKLRALATNQPGYISGETLKNIDQPNEYLVISTWLSLEAWERWKQNKARMELQVMIDTLLGEVTEYGVYSYS